MSRILFILSLCAFLATAQAQQPRSWYFGLNMQAQKYWLYNYNDFNNEWLLPVAPKALVPNALSGGISFGRGFKKHFAFQADIQYSSQTQKFYSTYPNAGPKLNIICRLNYIKIPLVFQYNYLKWAKKTAGFYAEAGLQTSFLGYFKQIATSTPDEDPSVSHQVIYEPHQYSVEVPYPSGNTYVWPAMNLFKNLQVGAIFGFGFKKVINEEYLLQAGFRFDYDLTNADDLTYGKEIYRSNLRYVINTGATTGNTRTATHNTRVGLNFSISYFFNN